MEEEISSIQISRRSSNRQLEVWAGPEPHYCVRSEVVQSTYIGNMPFLNNTFSPLFRGDSNLHTRHTAARLECRSAFYCCTVNAHINPAGLPYV